MNLKYFCLLFLTVNHLAKLGYGFDDDNEYGSSDRRDSDQEGSASIDETPCQIKRRELLDKHLVGAYIPQCTADGAYEAKQCYSGQRHCWCVTFDGQEIPNTSKETINCNNLDRNRRILVVPSRQPTVAFRTTSFVQAKPTVLIGVKNTDADVIVITDEPKEFSLMKEPWIIAVIVVGCLLCLLFAILCIMLALYRLRKKDEGTYVLEEPKQALIYFVKPPQEFFA